MSKLRAAFFDLDGTLKLERDPYQVIHRSLGWGEKTQQFAEMYRRGEIDSDEWIRRDVRLWRGLRRDFLTALVAQIPYTPGAGQVVTELKRAGALVVVVSTGPQFHADRVKEELSLDCAIANEVVFETDVATGEVIINVREADKASIVTDLLKKTGISGDECLAVGDGEADVGMFEVCRLGVAVQPFSERVRRSAQIVLDRPDLSQLLTEVYELIPEWQGVVPCDQHMGESCPVVTRSEGVTYPLRTNDGQREPGMDEENTVLANDVQEELSNERFLSISSRDDVGAGHRRTSGSTVDAKIRPEIETGND